MDIMPQLWSSCHNNFSFALSRRVLDIHYILFVVFTDTLTYHAEPALELHFPPPEPRYLSQGTRGRGVPCNKLHAERFVSWHADLYTLLGVCRQLVCFRSLLLQKVL